MHRDIIHAWLVVGVGYAFLLVVDFDLAAVVDREPDVLDIFTVTLVVYPVLLSGCDHERLIREIVIGELDKSAVIPDNDTPICSADQAAAACEQGAASVQTEKRRHIRHEIVAVLLRQVTRERLVLVLLRQLRFDF